MIARRWLVLTFGVCLAVAGRAAAQPLGTYRWQLTPYCNVVTLAVTQIGAQYRFEGFDDQCGAAARAAVTGLAIANPDGTLEFGWTIVTAGGPQHVDVTFSIPTLGGPWRDSGGNSGTLVFNPGAVSGPPRPAGLGAVAINPAQVQARVTGVCGTSQFVQGVNADGSVTCGGAGAGTITAVTAGTGLTGGGSSGGVSLQVDFGGPGAAGTAARSDHTHGFLITNTAVGASAASPSIMTGGNNTAVGHQAMQNTAAGASNTAVGAVALRVNVSGSSNTALGYRALSFNTTANANTAVGGQALSANVTGSANTAVGTFTLTNNLNGNFNVALGDQAMNSNTAGSSNVAVGNGALNANTTGGSNVAVGTTALSANVGSLNTAVGYAALGNSATGTANVVIGGNALASSTSASNNTVVGAFAMNDTAAGTNNTAIGYSALRGAGGGPNTAVGAFALQNVAGGAGNTAVGFSALANATGSNNVAIGNSVGSALVTGNNNIYINSSGVDNDNNTIRIGSGQLSAYIAGINGQTSSGGTAVYVNGAGQLGTSISSRRYKEQIASIGDAGAALQRLRPVTFLYKPEFDDGSRVKQYGLIAEEVDEVLPDLVVRNDAGEVQTVRYHFLTPLLVAEVQRLERERDQMRRTYDAALAALRDELAALRAAIERR